jgi:Ser/Thr protein kinase RdoA (MazF antagonist)
VLRLLQHFEAVGFAGAPRVIGDGFAADGRETLSYIEGSSPHPRAWSDDAGPAIGRLLRQAHDASASFDPGLDAIWKPWFGRDLPGSHPVIGHCDTGPWNVVATAGIPTAFIDWEFAGPTDARWELAEATWLNAQLHDDDLAEQLQLPDADSRARQARSIIDGYGLSAAERAGLVDAMIEFAVHSARADAVQYGVTAETRAGTTHSGYPFVWGIAWRTRSASWMLRQRALLERVIASRRVD